MDMVTLAAAKKYTKETAEGMGALVGPQGPPGVPGADGAPGADATINGVNTLEIEAGQNISLKQQGNTFTISATGGGSGGQTYIPGDGIEITETETGPNISVTTPVRGIITQAEYDALPEEQRNKGLYVVSGSSGPSVNNPAGELYSTEETQIGTWIDGKPLYQRTVSLSGTAKANTLQYTTITDEPNLSLISARGRYYRYADTDGDLWGECYLWSIPYIQVLSSSMIVSVSVGQTYFQETADESGDVARNSAIWISYHMDVDSKWKAQVTIEYTKTTGEGGNV